MLASRHASGNQWSGALLFRCPAVSHGELAWCRSSVMMCQSHCAAPCMAASLARGGGAASLSWCGRACCPLARVVCRACRARRPCLAQPPSAATVCSRMVHACMQSHVLQAVGAVGGHRDAGGGGRAPQPPDRPKLGCRVTCLCPRTVRCCSITLFCTIWPARPGPSPSWQVDSCCDRSR